MRHLGRIVVWFAIALQALGFAARLPEDGPMVAGFQKRLGGETISYHSPDPEVTAGLLVRSLDAGRAIEWETAPVPAGLDGEFVSFVWPFALQVDPARHRFQFSVDGVPHFEVRTPASNEVRDWTIDGPRGSSLRLRATMIDRFNDLMGYATLRVRRDAVKEGVPLRIAVRGESAGSRAWYITFQSSIAESASLTSLPAVVRTTAGEVQPLILSITHLGAAAEAVIETSFAGEVRRTLELGGNRIELSHPAVDRDTPVTVRIVVDGQEARVLRAVVPPVRHWSIDLVQHTHTDVGYTRPQTEILPEHLRFIDTALDYCDKTDGYPEEARFRWTCETSWAVREYLRTRTPAQVERLRRRAAEGRIEVTGMLLNMSEIVDEASYAEFLDPIRLSRERGMAVTTAVQNDVNGVAWCLADQFADVGIKYLIMGQHGHRALMPFDRPTSFWWESPAGRRVLAFRADHYHTGNFWGLHTGAVEAVETELLRHLERLGRSGYPFDRIAVEHSGYPTDNAPPSTASSEVVRRWNEKYVWPRLRCSIARDFPEYVERTHGAELPVVRGAWIDWWTDGFGSAARESAAARVTQGRLAATEAVLAMEAIAGTETPPVLRTGIDEVRDSLLMWGEHTMNSAESIREPLCENSQVQWAEKSAYAWDAVKREAALEEGVLGRLELVGRGGQQDRLLVINTAGWRRSGLLELYADHEIIPADRPFGLLDDAGRALPVQRLRSRAEGTYWAIWVPDVPAFGWRTFRIERRLDAALPTHVPLRTETIVESRFHRMLFDPARGCIASLVDKEGGAELVDAGAEWGFGGIVHESLGTREQLEGFRLDDYSRCGPSGVVLEGVEDGPIWSSLRFHAALPGCEGPAGLRCEIRLFHVEPRVELHYRIEKRRVEDPEAIYVAFPFAAARPEEATIRYETLGGVVDPERDIIPGAASDWQTMQSFIAVRHPAGQVVLSSNEVALVQCGAINLGKFQRRATIDRPHVYSWVMNNYWTTNFCASQEGEFRWSYALASSTDATDGFATRFGSSRRLPLLGRVLSGCDASGPTAGASLAFDVPNVLLVAARPARSGSGVVLQLRELDGRATTLAIDRWRIGGRPVSVRAANAIEAPGDELADGIPLGPLQNRFVLVEPRRGG